jgi:hypothetical protein
MTILLQTPVPESGRLSIHVHADVQINVTAVEAVRRVTQFVHQKISSQMHGETPVLILGERAYWRVPVYLTFPSFGNVGSVGSIDVDVETGEALTNEEIIHQLEHHAEEITRRLSSTTTR